MGRAEWGAGYRSMAETVAEQAASRIREGRLAGLAGLDGDAVPPAYDGLSIANLSATLLALLVGRATDPDGLAAPLWPPLWERWQGRVERVVLVVLDALGYQALRTALDTEPSLAFRRVAQAGVLAPLTSVFPSTTAAATTSLFTGAPPAQHGILGYELYLREFGRVVDMIHLRGRGARKARLELDSDAFVPVPSLAQRLAARGLPTFALAPRGILDSGLSRLHYRGAQRLGFVGSADMWVGIRHLLLARAGQPALVTIYWPGLDRVGHAYGPDTEMHAAELRNLAYSLGRELLDGLPAGARRRTLLVITADHGQIRTPPQDSVDLAGHPALARRLLMGPTGEARAAYLFAREGEQDAALAYVRETLSDRFAAWESEAALATGLFGPGPAMPEARARLGDIVLVGRESHSLYAADVHPVPAEQPGQHGGLSPDEMLVPWLAAHLEDVT